MLKKITFLFVTLLFISSFSWSQLKQTDQVIEFSDSLIQIRKGDQSFFKEISYENLLKFIELIRIEALDNNTNVFGVLYADDPDRWKESVVKSVAEGLLNNDPRVRLFSVHLLFKLAPKLSWIEKDIYRALEKETVDYSIFYTDIYGRHLNRNVREELNRLLDIDYNVILLYPSPNLNTYSKSLSFEWSGVYSAEDYELYINDVLYYKGKETLVQRVNLTLDQSRRYGLYRWIVIVKDRSGRIITKNSSMFQVRKLSNTTLKLYRGSQPRFEWNKIEGATFYQLYIYKDSLGENSKKLIYKGKNTYYEPTFRLPEGNYTCYLIVGNSYQVLKSNIVTISVDANSAWTKPYRDVPITKKNEEPKKVDKDLDFNIEDFKELEEDRLEKK